MSYHPNQQTIEMCNFETQGNVIDHSWYHIIKKKTAKSIKTDSNALMLLSDIVYWYKPTHKIDPDSGVHSIHKKFKLDILQRSYTELENQFGFTKEQSRSAIETLEELGIIEREFRTINISGTPVANIMFIKFHHKRLQQLMKKYYNDPEEFKKSLPLWEKTDDPVGKNTQGCDKKPTYTEITPETSPENACIAPAPSAVEVVLFNHSRQATTILKQDLYFMREKMKTDWTEGEIEFLWDRLVSYKSYVSDVNSLCHSIILSERTINLKKQKKEKKQKQQQQAPEPQGKLRSWDEFRKEQENKK